MQSVQMNNLVGCVRSQNRKLRNERIKEMRGVRNETNERITDNILRCFGYDERMNAGVLDKRVYKGENVGNLSVGRWKKWTELDK